jgi:choline dehydrogenase-like flavoprotein
MGTDPGNSAVNIYLRSWDVPNLFVQGASAFPENAGYNPTGTGCKAVAARADARAALETSGRPAFAAYGPLQRGSMNAG